MKFKPLYEHKNLPCPPPRNKAVVLRHNFEQLLSLSTPPDEIVVVDNGSTDPTLPLCEEIKHRCQKQNIGFTYMYEKEPGLSRSRNIGAQAATYEYILYLDDDCVPACEIIAEYKKALNEFSSTTIGGGTIIPRWIDNTPPQWLEPSLFWVFGEMRYAGSENRIMGRNETVNGGNFIVNKQALRDAGGFDMNLGNVDSIERGGEEQELFDRLHMYGKYFCAVCVPNAKVIHHFPLDRLTVPYVKERLRLSNYDRAVAECKHKNYFVRFHAIDVLHVFINSKIFNDQRCSI